MNTKEIERELDMLYYRLSRADALSMREYEVLQKANRIRYVLIENHTITLMQRVEALFLVKELFLKDITNTRMKRRVNEAIGYAYGAMVYLSPSGFADLIGVNRDRVSAAYERYQEERRLELKRA